MRTESFSRCILVVPSPPTIVLQLLLTGILLSEFVREQIVIIFVTPNEAAILQQLHPLLQSELRHCRVLLDGFCPIYIIEKRSANVIISTKGGAPLRIVTPTHGKIHRRAILSSKRPIQDRIFRNFFHNVIGASRYATACTGKHHGTQNEAGPKFFQHFNRSERVLFLLYTHDFMKKWMKI